MTELQYLEVERHDAVALVRFNRPKVMNALCAGLMDELAEAISAGIVKSAGFGAAAVVMPVFPEYDFFPLIAEAGGARNRKAQRANDLPRPLLQSCASLWCAASILTGIVTGAPKPPEPPWLIIPPLFPS